MKKNGLVAGILMLSLVVWATGGCFNDSSNNNTEKAALLLGLDDKMTQEQIAFSIVSAVPTVQTSMSSSTGKSNISSAEDMLAEINKNASTAFLKSELAAAGMSRSVTIVDEACEDGTCVTVSGSSNCANGGSMNYNNVKMNMAMESDEDTFNMTGTVNGTTTYSRCGVQTKDWYNYPDYMDAVIDGTIAQNGTYDIVTVLLAGEILSGSYISSSTQKGNTSVTSELLSVNGRVFSQVELNYTTDFMRNEQVSNYTYTSEGNLFTISGDYIETITGIVAVDGTLGPAGDIYAERVFNTETFRYHSACTMDTDNFSVSCTVTKM